MKDTYIQYKKDLTLLDGKKPILKDWVNILPSTEKAENHTGNFGWVLGFDDLVVDVDPRNGGAASFDALCLVVGDLEKTVLTAGGGWHCYLSKPKDLKLSGKLDAYPGIDFLSHGKQCVIAGSVIGDKHYTWADPDFEFFQEVNDKLVDLLTVAHKTISATLDLDDPMAGIEAPSQFDTMAEEQIIEYLSFIDNDIDNDTWVKVGMAIHSEYPDDIGLGIWDDWSQGGDTYNDRECAKRWKSFSKGTTSMGTLVHLAREGGMEQAKIEQGQTIIERINEVDGVAELRLEVVPDIVAGNYQNLELELFANAIKGRLTELGQKLPIKVCRDLVKPRVSKIGIDDAPNWCTDWVYVNTHKAYFHVEKLTQHNQEAFNLVNGVHVPLVGDSDTKHSASKFVADNGFVQLIDATAYRPMFANDRIINETNGSTALNTFNPNSVPVVASEFTDDGQEAIAKLEAHISMLCGNEETAELLKLWLCHNVQYPGEQILWAPLIQSIQGLGKSVFGALLRAVMGDENIGVVNPTQVMSDFNAWSTDRCVNILEELKLAGHNRHDVANNVKPLISDQFIQVNPKGVTAYQARNTTNYVGFTNFKDAIPLENSDRRWMVIYSPVESLDEIEAITGIHKDDYFPALFDAIRSNGPELRKWMLEYNVSDTFKNTNQAPMTEAKRMMAATEEAGVEGLIEVREMLKEGGKLWNKDVLSSSDMFTALQIEYDYLDIQTNRKAFILKKLGFMKYHSRVRLDGKLCQLWVRREMEVLEIRESLGLKA